MEEDGFGKFSNAWMTLFTAVVVFAAMLVFSLLLPSCGTVKTEPRRYDSVRVETVTKIEYLKDSVFFPVPYERESQITDTTSRLETNLAVSTASMTADGRLSHSLENKRVQLPIEVRTKVVFRDSIVWRERVETRTVEVERKLTWWETFKQKGFWVLFVIVVILLRKPIAAIGKSILCLHY